MTELQQRQEHLFRAIGGVGGDLVDAAERRSFPPGVMRRMLPVAVCLAVVVCLGWLAAVWFFGAPSGDVLAPEEQELPRQEQQEKTELPQETQEEIRISGPVSETKELLFWDVLYYAEARYTAQEAEAWLGERLGVVEDDRWPELAGAAVYLCDDPYTKLDSWGRQVPLEIFVEDNGDYWYCLTYYYAETPLMQWEQVLELWNQGKTEELADRLTRVPEQARAAGELQWSGSGGEMTPQAQVSFFRMTLQMEQLQGLRSGDLNQYLWKQDGGYAVPVEELHRQLDRYVEGYSWNPAELPGYSETYDAVLFSSLAWCSEEQMEAFSLPDAVCSLDADAKTLTIAFHQEDGTGRVYRLRFEPDRVVYERIAAVEEPLSEG